MSAFSEFLDVTDAQTTTAARTSLRAAATATDLEGIDAMSTISGAREEVSIYGTGLVHIPLVGKPEFAGLTFDDAHVPTATVKDGALTIETDNIDLLLSWRDAFQHAVAAMVIHRQRKEGRS